MAPTHDIEAAGLAALASYLQEQGGEVGRPRTETFDLQVDGIDAEVKAKLCPYEELDFIAFTENQFRALQSDNAFILFIVCNLRDPLHPRSN